MRFVRPRINLGLTLVDGSRVIVDSGNYTNVRFIIQEVYGQEVYEKDYRVKPGSSVVDVGANVGIFAIKAAREVGRDGSVLAIEPASNAFAKLNRNIALNRLDNIRAVRCAAGADAGEGLLFIKRWGDGNSTFCETPEHTIRKENVPIQRLDEIVRVAGLKRCDFLKIDTEGAELEVLKGARSLLAESRPEVAIETHAFGSKAEDVIDFLKSFGYSAKYQSNTSFTHTDSGYVYGRSANLATRSSATI